MRQWTLIGRARTPEGTELTLEKSGKSFIIYADGLSLMANGMHGSEEALSTFGCVRARTLEAPVVLVGGLGMGFTLRAALDVLPVGARVVVVELLEAVVEWNRGPLGHLADHPLRDPRVEVTIGDIGELLARCPERFDAVLMDVDNGPVAFSQARNSGLYGDEGLAIAKAALRPGGTLAVWSAWEDRKFEHRLAHAGFLVESRLLRARLGKGGPNHTILIGFCDDGSGVAPRQVLRPGERPDGRGQKRAAGPGRQAPPRKGGRRP